MFGRQRFSFVPSRDYFMAPASSARFDSSSKGHFIFLGPRCAPRGSIVATLGSLGKPPGISCFFVCRAHVSLLQQRKISSDIPLIPFLRSHNFDVVGIALSFILYTTLLSVSFLS